MTKLTIKEFIKKTKIKDFTKASFWYRMYILSKLNIEEFITGKAKKETKKGYWTMHNNQAIFKKA